MLLPALFRLVEVGPGPAMYCCLLYIGEACYIGVPSCTAIRTYSLRQVSYRLLMLSRA